MEKINKLAKRLLEAHEANTGQTVVLEFEEFEYFWDLIAKAEALLTLGYGKLMTVKELRSAHNAGFYSGMYAMRVASRQMTRPTEVAHG